MRFNQRPGRVDRRLTGFKGEIVWDTSKPNGQPRRGSGYQPRAAKLWIQARVPFEEGLRRTIDWYRENREQELESEA